MPDGPNHDSQGQAGAVAPPEVLLVCPECAAPLAAPAYEAHLRQAHRLVFFRGRLLPHDDALALLLNLVAAPTPDAEAWRTLAALARADHNQRADAFLAATLGGLLARVGGADRIYGIVFVVVAFSVIVQGATIPFVARRLGVPMRTVYRGDG